MACNVEERNRWVLGLASICWRSYPYSKTLVPMSPALVFWTPSGFLDVFYPTRSSFDKQGNINKKITSNAYKASMKKSK
jgi:hypothetical protein